MIIYLLNIFINEQFENLELWIITQRNQFRNLVSSNQIWIVINQNSVWYQFFLSGEAEYDLSKKNHFADDINAWHVI